MDSSLHSDNKKAAYTCLIVILGISVLIAGACFFLFNLNTAYSVLLGGIAFILPNYYFARLTFWVSGRESVDRALKFFMIGEVVKLILTGFIMAMCISNIKSLVVPAFFAMFVTSLIMNTILLHRSMPSAVEETKK